MITDKFPVLINDQEKENFPIYYYLGVKSNRQQASINSYKKRTIEQIVENNPNESFYNSLAKITEFLDLDSKILVGFEIKNQSHFWNPNLSEWDIEDYFNNNIERYTKREKSPPYSVTNYQSLKNSGLDVSKLINFREKVYRNGRMDKSFTDTKKKGLQYEIISSSEYREFQEDYKSLDLLRKIGFLKSPQLLFSKLEKGFELSKASSGQQHFFSTIIGLLATIKPNSLILIDEPETSLHPNWQMRYLDFLYQLFDNEVFSTCHFIIATHSHFLISDLDGKKGSIIGLKANGEIKPVKNNTYGWSAEQVLLDIFEVPTTRNRYIADKIGKILQLIAKKTDDRETITKKVNELVELNLNNLSSNDPLYPIWKKILDKYGTRS
jgi:predicted ATP-dependent endonuclease of OLD family